ncbi:alpha-L-rhamnosidase [Paenibacillus segetis]|uniref:alpha-L-rhamnosidase n=1 Tax=Paenibacillus segetis TaxID=1325360 RepID=A0ABQ1YT70_9BACL|nr:alpha-L-rhamnosidase [Paenibacillus segetis]GGH35200.1 alfa-L-rhamnosidase [Paenibacillus segetis]
MTELNVFNLTAEYRSQLLGTGVTRPRMSWQLESDKNGTYQTAYRVQVNVSGEDFIAPLWDTEKVESDSSVLVQYEGPELRSSTRYYYRVKVWDNFGRESEWSEAGWWETALLDVREWKAAWITPDPQHINPQVDPAFMLRRTVHLEGGEIASARIYATALGVYELYLNGAKVGEDLLAPGWTSYNKRLQYQTYDVTKQVRAGDNAVGIMLANGWYKGRLGWENQSNHYGERRAALVQLHISYEDGSEEVIVSDANWRGLTGPVRFSEIYDGETYDARLDHPGWSEATFADEDWQPTVTLNHPFSGLRAQENVPTRITEILKPVSVILTPSGETVLDMGQNMVGRIRMQVEAPRDQIITLTHAEVLDKDGNFYIGNIRTAKQTVKYTAAGAGKESYAPHFTFQGFRYVKIEGYPGQENGLPLEAFTGEVIHSEMDRTGHFECSDEMVNQLQRNIVWGQRGNFLDVPTDCPQRDERLGWTGDTQVFAGAALFNYNASPFFSKWLRDLAADQLPDGGVPFVVPNVLSGYSSAAWGDAATIVPWAVYSAYGDKRLLSEQYSSMKAWVDYIRSQGDKEHVWDTGFHFGDWLALDAKEGSYIGATPSLMVTAAYFALSTRIVRDTAEVLGYIEDAAYYGKLANRIVQAYRNEFITPNGRVAAQTQTAQILALTFDLADPKDRPRISKELNEMIVDNDYHLTTGFVGTPYLCFALSDNGYHETAVKLLLQQTYPGWLYSVSKGATTIWEHWDGIKPDGSFWSDDMNSYNHYAYGAIGEWMYRRITGLSPESGSPGYKRIQIAPKFEGGRLSYAKAHFRSIYGVIEAGWAFRGEQVEVNVVVPPNTTADIRLPDVKLTAVRVNEDLLSEGGGILRIEQKKDAVFLEAGSGKYVFTFPRSAATYRIWTPDMHFSELVQWESARQILDQHAPGLTENLGLLRNFPLAAAAFNPMGSVISEQQYEVISAELSLISE